MPVFIALLAITGAIFWLLFLAGFVLAAINRKKIFTLLQYARQYLAISQRMNQRKNFKA